MLPSQPPAKAGKQQVPERDTRNILQLIDIDDSFSYSDEAVVIEKTEKTVTNEKTGRTSPTPKDDFQCSKVTLFQQELRGTVLRKTLKPNIDIKNGQVLEKFFRNKLMIA